MSKEKDVKRTGRKLTVIDEINGSIYALAVYLSEYVYLLRASANKPDLR